MADIYELGEENIKYGMYIFTELFWDRIKSNREIKKAIYLDEIWRLIGVTSNKYVASFIYKIFKTIRKYGGSAVAITQDVSDWLNLLLFLMFLFLSFLYPINLNIHIKFLCYLFRKNKNISD